MTTLPRADDPAADPELVPLLARAAAGVPHVLDLTYLPQVDLASGEVVGVDVKLRVAHPRRGLLAPARFWPAAQTAGLLSALARQAVRRCVREVQAHRSSARHRSARLGPATGRPRSRSLTAGAGRRARGRARSSRAGPAVRRGRAGYRADLAFRLAALRGAGAAVAVLTDGGPRWRDCLTDGLGVDALRLSPRLVRTVAHLVRDGPRRTSEPRPQG